MTQPSTAVQRPTSPRVWVTLGVIVLAVLLGATANAGAWALTAMVALAGLVLAWGWAGTLSLPTPRGTVAVVAMGTVALGLAVALPQQPPWLGWVPAALCLSMIVAFGHQLLRRDGRPRVVISVSSVVWALALIASGMLAVPMARTPEGVALILGSLAAVVASSLTDLLARVNSLRVWLTALAMLGGAFAAVAVALALHAPWTTWLLVGVISAALSHAVRRVLGDLPTLAHPRPRLVAAIASVLVAGVVPSLVAYFFLPVAILS